MSPRPTPPWLPALRLTFQGLHALSPALSLRLAEQLFSLPRRHRTPEVERAALREGRAFHFQSRGLRLRGHLWGEGPAVALLHGWEGRGTQLHAFIHPLLEAGFSAATFDQPGHGASRGLRAGPVEWSRALGDFVKEIGPIHGLVAHSLGAAGVAIAMDQGLLKVPRAVFLSPPAEPDPFYGQLLAMMGFPIQEHPAAFESFGARIGIPWDRLRLRSLAQRLSGPLLVIHDQDDREVPWTSGAEVASAWPSARLLVTRGLGHRRILRDPAVIGEAVAFLRQAPASAALPFHGDGPRSLEWHLFHRDLRTA